MIRIGLLGYSGRMGQAIAAEIAGAKDCILAAALVREGHASGTNRRPAPLLSTKIEDVIGASDVIIDFTLAEATPDFARLASAAKKPFMCGVTGLSETGLKALKDCAAKSPVLYAPNTSVSLAVMKRVTEFAAKLLGDFDYDVVILDQHHRNKKDAPSGTATALGEAVVRGNGGKKKPSFSAIRAGAIVGEHDVSFVGQGEIIRLQHSVTDRAIFARGALQAALWLAGKPAGFYGMDDVLGIGAKG